MKKNLFELAGKKGKNFVERVEKEAGRAADALERATTNGAPDEKDIEKRLIESIERGDAIGAVKGLGKDFQKVLHHTTMNEVLSDVSYVAEELQDIASDSVNYIADKVEDFGRYLKKSDHSVVRGLGTFILEVGKFIKDPAQRLSKAFKLGLDGLKNFVKFAKGKVAEKARG